MVSNGELNGKCVLMGFDRFWRISDYICLFVKGALKGFKDDGW